MGEVATSPPPAALPVFFVDGDRSVELGNVQPSLGVRKLQAVVADRVGLSPNQISAFLARSSRRAARRVPLDDATDLAAAVAREGAGCYVQAGLRRSRRGGRSRRDKRQQRPPQQHESPEKIILKRLPPTDLAALAAAPGVFGGAGAAAAAWDYEAYEAHLMEMQRHRDWFVVNSQPQQPPPPVDPYFAFAPPPPQLEMEMEEPMWSPRCQECDEASAAMREPAFHRCVRDAVTVGFRSRVGPVQRPPPKMPPSPSPSPPPKKSPSASPPPAFHGGMTVY